MVAGLETNQYLDGHQDWIAAVESMAESFPLLQSIDLIIEGCIGGNPYCSYWLKQILNDVLYVGTDIAPRATTLNSERVDGGIDQDQFLDLKKNQAQLADDGGRSSLVTFRANCLSDAFINSLKKHSGAKAPMLVTFNGLLALLGTNSNPGERKPKTDLTNVEKVAQSDLFLMQLHLYERAGFSLWEGEADVTKRWFYLLEKTANDLGVKYFRIKDGLVVINDASQK